MSVESQPNNIDDLIAEFKELSAEDSDMYIAFVQLDTKEVWELKACLSIRTRTTFNILATAAAQIVDPNSEGDLVRQWFVNVFRMVPELVGSDSTDYLGNASVGDGDNEREVIFKTSTIPNAARASATALLRFKMERRTETPAGAGGGNQGQASADSDDPIPLDGEDLTILEKRSESDRLADDPGAKLASVAPEKVRGEAPPTNTTVLLSCADLARRHNLSFDALRKRLGRERAKNCDCYIEMDDSERKKNDPKYLYRSAKVQHVIDGMKRG